MLERNRFCEVLQIDRVVSGDRSADVAPDFHNLACRRHRHRGRSADGEAGSRQAVALRRDLLGPTHPQTPTSTRPLGDILKDRGQPAAALPLSGEACDGVRTALDAAIAAARSPTPARSRH